MTTLNSAVKDIDLENSQKKESALARIVSRRRKYVLKVGKRLIFSLDKFIAHQSLVPNDPVLDPGLFPWMADIEADWQLIRDELAAVLKYRHELPLFQEISPDQKRISPDDKWRTFFLYGFGHRSEQNCRLCPETARLLDRIPGIETAFFSILAPGKIVPPHRGITKGLIRCHLGLSIPSKPDLCHMDVGDVRCTWQEGKVLVFDDSYVHAVSNISDEERVVLLFDFPRPLAFPGRIARRLAFWLFHRTAYVQDALRNEACWEQRRYSG